MNVVENCVPSFLGPPKPTHRGKKIVDYPVIEKKRIFTVPSCCKLYIINSGLYFQGQWFSDNYGLAMKIMWGLGLLAAGQSSTMTVSSPSGRYIALLLWVFFLVIDIM